MNNILIKNISGINKLFTTIDLEKNDILFQFEGKSYSFEDPKRVNDSFLQIGKTLYLDVKNNGSFINHSCNPNCYVRVAVNAAFLMTSMPIKAGEELTIDYSLTSNENIDSWSMNCNCSRFQCRRIISGANTIPEDKLEKLIAAGMIPKYIKETL